MSSEILIHLDRLHKSFVSRDSGRKSVVKAVDDITLDIYRGETLGLVGESGSGKTTLGRTIMRLIEPDSGSIWFDGKDITHEKMGEQRRRMQMIFQNPAGFLDPRMRVDSVISEGLRGGRSDLTKDQIRERVEELLGEVGLSQMDAYRYPGEFSGGQQQRIGIARALAVNPSFIVCDEPVSALDVSYQSQIINLLEDLQERMGLTYLFISHDLSVVMHISDRIGVMYLGRIVELGSREDIFRNPVHPYTKALISAIPIPDPRISRQREHIIVNTDEAHEKVPEHGCRYAPICPLAGPECTASMPENKEVAPGHFAMCHKV